MSANRRFARRLVAPVSALMTSLMAVFCAALTGMAVRRTSKMDATVAGEQSEQCSAVLRAVRTRASAKAVIGTTWLSHLANMDLLRDRD